MIRATSPGSVGGGGWLPTAALAAVVVAAVGSVEFMLRAGQRNPSQLLLLLFAAWIVAPFVAMIWTNRQGHRWSPRTRTTLDWIMVLIAISSLAIYGSVALGPPRAQTAFVFVVVPLASWVCLAMALAMAAIVARRS